MPLYGVGISSLHLALHAVRATKSLHALKGAPSSSVSEGASVQYNALQRLIQRAGSPTVFIYKLTRLLCSLILVTLSLVTVFRYHRGTGTDTWWIHLVEPAIYVRWCAALQAMISNAMASGLLAVFVHRLLHGT